MLKPHLTPNPSPFGEGSKTCHSSPSHTGGGLRVRLVKSGMRIMYRLEVIASNVTEALEAQAGGAHSIELCVDLTVGGLTPPLDVARAVRDAVSIDVNMMIRPHAESFYYSPHDIDLI